jgi:secreted trypsin-like serine protease
MRRLVPFPLCFALLAVLVGCGASDTEPDAIEQGITDGQSHSGHPSVGWLAIGSTDYCTATLVGKRTLLTVAHCIVTGDQQNVNVGGVAYVASTAKVQMHPSYDPVNHDNDIALIALDQEPPIAPSVISRSAVSPGVQVTLVGFGSTAESAQDWGVKRMASNTVREVASTTFTIEGTGGGLGNTCYGDSGGPVFAVYGGKEVQIGVSLGGASPCGTKSVATRVDAFAAWLTTASGGDLADGSNGTSGARPSDCAVAEGGAPSGGLLLALGLVLAGLALSRLGRYFRKSSVQ